jgi:hypothetical protein
VSSATRDVLDGRAARHRAARNRIRIADLTLENERLQRIIEVLETRVEEFAVALAAARDTPTPEPAPTRQRPAIR